MDKRSKILLWLVAVLVVISVGALFYKILILQDFTVIQSDEE